MRLAAFLGAWLVVASCVPDAAPPAARGAVGARIHPTAATSGSAFVTSDGWTVTIDGFVLYVRATATEANEREGEPAEGLFMWNGQRRAELVLRAVLAGPRVVRVHVLGAGFFSSDGNGESFYTNIDVDPALEKRFNRPPDGPEGGSRSGPDRPGVGVLLTLHASKDERMVSLDIALAGARTELAQSVEVVGDEIRFVELDLAAERLIGPAFDDLAKADANADGILTGAELAAATVTHQGRTMSSLEGLADRISTILAPR